MMCDTPHWLKCVHERVMSSHMLIHVVRLSVCSLTHCSSPCSFACVLSNPLLCSFHLYLDPDLNPLPPCGRRQGNYPLALRQLRRLAPWSKTPLSQVLNPSPLTISTSRRLLKSSSGTNPATRCPRTCSTGNSDDETHRQSALFTTVHSGARRTSEPETSLSLF